MIKKFLALAFAFLFATAVQAQNVTVLPYAAQAVADIGNGPIKVRVVQGNASIFTTQGSGTGSTSGASTTLTLTGTPATPPLVGGLISGNGITSGTTVTAYNGTTGITLSAAMTVPGGTAVAWGAACPADASGIPPNPQYIQASVTADYFLLYTQARVCAVSPGGPANTLLVSPVFYDQTTQGGGTGSVTFANPTATAGPTAINGSAVTAMRSDAAPAVQPASASQAGLMPQWPGTTTTFFRGDGSFQPLNFAALANQATLAQLPQLGSNSVYLNATGSAAQPTSFTIPACAADGQHALTYTNGTGIVCTADVGTVASVGLALPGIFSVSGSPVTGSGTLTGTLATQLANIVFAGPTSGGAAAPTFRSLVVADLPAAVVFNNVADQVLTGGFLNTSQQLTSGNITPDCGTRGLQWIINTGAFTITAPAPATNVGYCNLRVINGNGAGAITFPTGSGQATSWSVGANTGDAFATTLKHTASCTATSASPAVFTDTAHGLPNGWPVYLSGTTAPTGFTLGTVYYTVSVATNTYQLALTPGGASINSSSTGTAVVCNAASQFTLSMEQNIGGATYAWKALQ